MKIRSILVFILLIACLLSFSWFWHFIHKPSTLPIKTVMVKGQYRFVKPNILRKTVTPYIENGFLNLDVQQAQNALLKIPGVKTSSVRRVWPNKVIIKITERTAFARWNKNSLISKSGIIFAPDLQIKDQNLLEFVGNKADAKAIMTMYHKITPKLQADKLQIQTLKYGSLGNWQIKLKNGPWLELGFRDTLQRLQLFLSAYPELKIKAGRRQIKYVNLQYKNGFAVKYK